VHMHYYIVTNRRCKNRYFCHIFVPWGRPWGNNAKRCINEKTTRCLQIVTLYVPVYNYNRFLNIGGIGNT